ncbi:MAG: NAD(P)/FAD-dependent oxidoreductase, partial [Actinomycetota bacterium]
MRRIVVVGSSVAGIRAAETLRQAGFDGTVTVITEESGTPHDRPPLSKKFLSGDVDEERIALRKPEMLDALGLEWLHGSTAVGFDAATRTIALSSGATVTADGVVIATGGRARSLPNVPMVPGVHVLRTLKDANGLRADLKPGAHLVVIGAGFIGLEAAATAAQMGVQVTVLEGAPAPLIRGLGEQMGAAVAAVHARNGVQVRCGVSVQGIEHDGRVSAVLLGDGERIVCDAVLLGIGVAPATQWLEGSGLELRDGVVCDEFLSTGFAGVYAAGDLLRWPNAMFAHVEADMRVEHWTNAAEQGAAAATNLLAELQGGERT